MNNLKRILSLALASVMLVGMMVVGASAKEFTDADDITNKDAVDTLVALKVIDGMDPEHFVPNGDVTRAQMAKMIAFALNGGKAPNVGLPTNMTFTDVPATHWAAEYVEYCANLGIIDGRGNGIFDPEGKVTGQEAAKMMLVAIGYDVNDFSLKGANWAINVDLHASNLGLYDDVRGFSRNPLTRENAAQLIYNGIQAPTASRTKLVYGSNGVSYEYDLAGNPLLATSFGADMVEGRLTQVSYDDTKKEYTYTIGGNSVTATVDVSDKIGQNVNLVYLDGDVVAITTKFNGVLSSGYINNLNDDVAGKLDGFKTYQTQADVKVYTVTTGALVDSGKNATNYDGNKYDAYRLVDANQDSVIDLMVVFPVTIARVTEIDAAGNVANTESLTIAPATSTIPELEAGDYILATTNGKGGYTVTKATTVSGTVTSVRGTNEVRINGVWYKSIAAAEDDLSSADLGEDKTLVLVGGTYAFADDYDDGSAPEVSKDLAVVVALGTANALTGAQQANLVLADGSVLTAVNVKAGKDTTLTEGNLYNYKADGNAYTLTTATKASTGFGSELQTGNGYTAGTSAKEAKLNGTYYINDDAVVIYAYKSTATAASDISDTNKQGAMTGKDLKDLGGNFGDNGKCQYFYKTVDGLKYVQFAVLVELAASNKLPDARDAKGTESYGFVVSAVAKEYNVDDESVYCVYTIWNGTSNVEVTEKGSTTQAVKGAAIKFEDLGDGKVTNVTKVTDKVSITGFSKANGVLTVSGGSYKLTDNTVYFNVNTTANKQAGVAGTKLEVATDGDNAWIVTDDNGNVKAIFVETVNKKLPTE